MKGELIDEFKSEMRKFFKGFQATSSKENAHSEPCDCEGNVNVEDVGWIKKYLYPYAIDLAPLRKRDLPEEGQPIGSTMDDKPI